MTTTRYEIAAQSLSFAIKALGHDTTHGKAVSELCRKLLLATQDRAFFLEASPLERETLEAVRHMVQMELDFMDRCDANGPEYSETDPTLWAEGFLDSLEEVA